MRQMGKIPDVFVLLSVTSYRFFIVLFFYWIQDVWGYHQFKQKK